MKIYESEKTLASLIQNGKTCSFVLPINITDEKSDSFIESISKIEKSDYNSKMGKALAKLAEDPHPDLMYASAILVSTAMNKNDDVFLPSETWAARYTAINTPFNDEHIETEIIGHIIASRALDKDGSLIEDQEDVPNYFDIEVDLVVYKGIFPSIAKDISDKAPEGEKFVSMEAKFSNFDYAIFDDKSSARVIGRNESTAFLTKYLRAYGGTGYYEGKKIGRVLRNFRFVGMGSVDTPANPSSEYTKLDDKQINEKVESGFKVVLHVAKGNVMKIETLDEALKVIADLTNKVEQLEDQNKKNETDELKAQIKTLNEDLSAANSKVEIAEKQIKDEQSKYSDITKTLDSTKAELSAKSSELDKINSDARLNDRLAKYRELNIEVTDERRSKIAAMSDDAFASVIEFAQLIKKSDNTSPEALAEAEKAAQAALDASKKSNSAIIENTSGDDEVEKEKFQKVAAKLVDTIRKTRPLKKK